jgi:hypothetical protein
MRESTDHECNGELNVSRLNSGRQKSYKLRRILTE